MTKRQDISELVSRAQEGNRESLGVLSAHVRQRVFVYLYRMTLDYHLAEDLVQETVLYMIESLPRLNTTSSLSLWAWIYRSAWGKFQHYLRPQGHQRIVQRTVVDHEALLQLTDDTEESALEQAERAELFEAICKSLGTLQTKHRNVLVLRCFELLSHAEIASIMGCSELKSRVLFFHAKHALKRHLHNRGYGRRYFVKGLSLFGLITGMHAKSASAAITVTSSLVKTETIAAAIGAVIAKLGVMKTAVITIVLVAGTIFVCSSDADKPTEATVNPAAGRGANAFAMPEVIGDAGISDLLPKKSDAGPVLPDPCGVGLYRAAGTLPVEQTGRSWSAAPVGMAQPAVQADLLADPNEIRTRVKSFDGLEKAIQDVGAGSAGEQRYWEQTRYDNRTLLARAVHKQVAEELALVRKVAVEEKATKTTEAVDTLVAKRKARYGKVNKELLQQRREASAGQSSRAGDRTRASTRSPGRGYSSGYDHSSSRVQESQDRDTQEEIRQWTRATVDDKRDLARATHDQICGEIALIRGVAAEEEARKTTAAIDGLLLARKERLDAFMNKGSAQRKNMQSGRRRRR